MKRTIELYGPIVGLVVGLLALLFAIAWTGASWEAASYRKFCDTPVTAWDALFLDLRIDECKKCSEPTEGE